jgi:hypothetical protein
MDYAYRPRRFVLISLLGCAAAAPAAEDAAQTLERLRDLAGHGACDDTAQCHTVAVGAKACGGPEAYLAWSDADPATAPRVAALAAQYAAARRAANRAAPAMASDCRLVPDPGAMCRLPAPAASNTAQNTASGAAATGSAAAGQCVLRPAGMRDPT